MPNDAPVTRNKDVGFGGELAVGPIFSLSWILFIVFDGCSNVKRGEPKQMVRLVRDCDL